MIKITDEYREVAKEYRKMFGYGVPLSMIPPTVDIDEFIKRVDKALSEDSVESKLAKARPLTQI